MAINRPPESNNTDSDTAVSPAAKQPVTKEKPEPKKSTAAHKKDEDDVRDENINQNTIPGDPERPTPEDKASPGTILPPGTEEADPINHPQDTTATTRYNEDIGAAERRKKATEVPVGDVAKNQKAKNDLASSVKLPKSSDNDTKSDGYSDGRTDQAGNEVNKQQSAPTKEFTPGMNTDNMPVMNNEADVGRLKDGDLFLALFAHNNRNTDDIWHVKQNIDSIRTGSLIYKGVPASYWTGYSENRPPIGKKTASGFVLLG